MCVCGGQQFISGIGQSLALSPSLLLMSAQKKSVQSKVGGAPVHTADESAAKIAEKETGASGRRCVENEEGRG